MFTFLSGIAIAIVGAVPTFLTIGSTARRQLSLINAESEALERLPKDHPGRAILNAQIERSVEQYCSSRTNKFDASQTAWQLRLPSWIPMVSSLVGLLLYVTGALAYTLHGRDELSTADRLRSPDRNDLIAVSTFLLGLAVLGVTTAILLSRRRRRREISFEDWAELSRSAQVSFAKIGMVEANTGSVTGTASVYASDDGSITLVDD